LIVKERVRDVRRIGLRQVAERAGVSLATASNVFAAKPWVSSAIRDQVLAAAAELRYQPRRRGKAEHPAVSMLGFVLRHNTALESDPFYSDLLRQVEQACAIRGLSLAHARVPAGASRIEDLPPMIQRRQVQGLLAVGAFSPEFYALLQQVHLPWVSLDHFDETLPTDCISGSDEYGGYLATRHLIELGHRSPPPAMLAPDSDRADGPNADHRWRGYCRALAEFGIPYDQQYVPRTELAPALAALMNLSRPPTSIFCWNDPAALFALNALRERGISVPQECSVVGYDDIYLAAGTVPPLTTVRVDRQLIARQGVANLIERIAEPNLSPRNTRVAVTLVKRQSAGPSGMMPQRPREAAPEERVAHFEPSAV
jgi:LacI family transcriptional regulator